MGRSGCYKIVNHTNGKMYIGSAVNMQRRMVRHRTDLRGGRHDNGHLQRAFDRDGEDAFTFEVIAPCDPGSLLEWEQAFIDAGEPEYNILRVAGGGRYGIAHSPETKAKMSAAAQGHTLSAESRAKLSASRTGKKLPPFTQEHREKMGAAQIGNKRWLGKKHKPETIEKIRAAALEREARKRQEWGAR